MGLWRASRVPGRAVPAEPTGRMRRPAVAGAGWLAAAGLATLIGLGGIRLVGDSLTGTPGGVLSRDQVERALAEASEQPTEPAPALPEPDLSEPGPDSDGTATEPTPDSATAPATGPATAPATAPATGPATVRRSFSVSGGTAVAACRGATAYLLSWSPTQGNRVDRSRPGPAREVEVRFRGDDGHSELKITCAGGVPVAERKDEDDEDD